jgi:hypothetical protein
MPDRNMFTKSEIGENIIHLLRGTGNARMERDEISAIVINYIKSLDHDNRQAVLDFLCDEIKFESYGYGELSREVVIRMKYSQGYEALFCFFIDTYHHVLAKLNSLEYDETKLKIEQVKLYTAAMILFMLGYRGQEPIYKEYIVSVINKNLAGVVDLLLVRYSNVDREWAISKLVEYYISAFPDPETSQHVLQREDRISNLLSLNTYAADNLALFLKKLFDSNKAVYERVKNIILAFLHTGAASRWRYTRLEIENIESELRL